METTAWDVFIAYPAAQRHWADELYAGLLRGGARTFLDHKVLSPGAPWPSDIAAAQRDSRATAVLVAGGTDGAFYQSEEIAQGIALFRKDPKRHRVVPIYLDEKADPPYGLRSLQGIWTTEVGGIEGVTLQLLALIDVSGDPPAGLVKPTPGTVSVKPSPPRRSPFRPGLPLYVSDLLPGGSRRALVETLANDLIAGNNVNLVGERRLGRTSILNHLYGRLLIDGDNVLARVNVQENVGAEDRFYGAVLAGMARHPLVAKSVPPARRLELEHEMAANYDELRKVLKDVRGKAVTILLVDEFERCFDSPQGYPLPGFYDNVRSLLGGDEEGSFVKAVLATRQSLAIYFDLRQVTSVLPSYLPPRRIELLTDDDIEETLTQASPHQLGPGHRAHASQMGGRHPCRIQSAGEAWYRGLSENRDRRWVEEEFKRLSSQTCLGADTSESPAVNLGRLGHRVVAMLRAFGRIALATFGRGDESIRQVVVGIAVVGLIALVVAGAISGSDAVIWIRDRLSP